MKLEKNALETMWFVFCLFTLFFIFSDHTFEFSRPWDKAWFLWHQATFVQKVVVITADHHNFWFSLLDPRLECFSRPLVEVTLATSSRQHVVHNPPATSPVTSRVAGGW